MSDSFNKESFTRQGESSVVSIIVRSLNNVKVITVTEFYEFFFRRSIEGPTNRKCECNWEDESSFKLKVLSIHHMTLSLKRRPLHSKSRHYTGFGFKMKILVLNLIQN